MVASLINVGRWAFGLLLDGLREGWLISRTPRDFEARKNNNDVNSEIVKSICPSGVAEMRELKSSKRTLIRAVAAGCRTKKLAGGCSLLFFWA